MSKKIKTPPADTPPAPPRLDTLGRPISSVKRGPDKKFRRPRGVPAPYNPLYSGRGQNGVKLRDQRVRRLVQRMRKHMDWLTPSDIPAARGWAELEILSAALYMELKTRGVFTQGGEARKLVDDFRKMKLAQLMYARDLGMTPSARQAIRADSTGAALDLIGSMSADAIESANANGADAIESNGAAGSDNEK